MAEIRLGDKVKDVYTGLVGTATSRHVFLYGCTRIYVEPTELKDGKVVDASSFDEQRLEVVEPGNAPEPPTFPTAIMLGDEVKDRLTGYAGVATALSTYLHSTPRILVEAKGMKDGKPVEAQGFDVQRLSLVEQKPVENHAPHVKTGGPQPNESRLGRSDPR